MKINFILPFPTLTPGGGTKVMYEYANRLAGKGHEISFYHSIKTSFLPYRVPYFIRLLYFTIVKRRVPTWFPLLPQIKSINIPRVADKYIKDADIIISSWWATAFEVNELSLSKGRKFNFIQDYEVWTGNEDMVIKSYSLPARKIVYVKYLQDLFAKMGLQSATLIPIGIDPSLFFLFKPVEERNQYSIAMLYSEEPRKATRVGLKALGILKELFPQLVVNLFGVFPKPVDLPGWINYFEKPGNLNEIYNSSAIYVTPALQEGWALPPAEAMTCGCALVCSDIPGHQDYAAEGITALKFKPNDENAMIASLRRILEDNSLRLSLAKNGHEFCKRYDWNRATDMLEKFFLASKMPSDKE
jgi:glycosyltransferase involved in cell wall biosynthesis